MIITRPLFEYSRTIENLRANCRGVSRSSSTGSAATVQHVPVFGIRFGRRYGDAQPLQPRSTDGAEEGRDRLAAGIEIAQPGSHDLRARKPVKSLHDRIIERYGAVYAVFRIV